ncbi:class II aldolase/adducin family protein [Hoeflea sp. CAU 1731]
MTETLQRREIVQTVRELQNHGLNHGNSGNVSVRSQYGLFITPTGCNAVNATEEGIVQIDMDGKVVGDGIPSSEWHMHLAIMRAFPAAKAVIHTHADACVALSCLREPLPAFHYMVAAFGGNNVRCARYATFGTSDLADSAVEALQDRTACLLANHGMIAMGVSLEQTLGTTVKLETLARQYLMALQGGAPKMLSDEEMTKVGNRYKNYGVGTLEG